MYRFLFIFFLTVSFFAGRFVEKGLERGLINKCQEILYNKIVVEKTLTKEKIAKKLKVELTDKDEAFELISAYNVYWLNECKRGVIHD